MSTKATHGKYEQSESIDMHAIITIHSQNALPDAAPFWKSLLPKLRVLPLGAPTDRVALIVQGDKRFVDDALRLVWTQFQDELIQASLVRLDGPAWEAVDPTTAEGLFEMLPIPEVRP
jgi:hypothetical protein